MNVVRASAWIVLAWLTPVLAEATPEFTGYLTGPDERFVMTDAATGQKSGLLAAGQSFAGYQIIAFDRAHEVLTVQRGGETLRLNLKQSNSAAAAYASIPLSMETNHPNPAGGVDLIATKEDRTKFLKKIQKALKDVPVPNSPQIRPSRF